MYSALQNASAVAMKVLNYQVQMRRGREEQGVYKELIILNVIQASNAGQRVSCALRRQYRENKQNNFSQELKEQDQLSDVVKIPISSLSLMDTVSLKNENKRPIIAHWW